MLKTKKDMMKEVSKSAALLNAQAIMASAVMFGHGDVVTLSVNEEAVVLSLVYDTAYFVYDREVTWICDRAMCGIKCWGDENPSLKTTTIYVAWKFNPNLK